MAFSSLGRSNEERTVRVKEGDKLPEFSLSDQNGKSVDIKNLIGKKVLVIYFYPKDDTPGCTKEACTFRDSYDDFKRAGAEVIGISSDDEASHKKFAATHHLPFILLADSGGKVRKLMGVPKTMGLLPGRVTYIVDKKGIVRHVFNSQFQAEKHVEESLEVIKRLEKE
ncbi:peroxiredoxin [bacterium]|nr:peroxiredoxin [bacterium]